MWNTISGSTLSDSEAYEALVKHYCAKSQRLDMLTYVDTNGNYLDGTQLASWIPDWRPSEPFAEARQPFSNLTRPLPFDTARGSSADTRFDPASQSTSGKPRIRENGCILDRLSVKFFFGTKYERAKQNI
jgi:hypothetical protein